MYRLLLAGFVFLFGCVQAEEPQISSPQWQTRCSVDAVSGAKTCRAFTFGRSMDHTGQPFNSASIPFQVLFENGRGPLVMVGFHTYPGRRPEVRFDDDRNSFTIPNDNVGRWGSSPNVVARMRTASIARGRYHVWPEGSRDIWVDLRGFNSAYEELLSIK